MNILIVGNGFDLSHYLPTKYDHFMVAMGAIESWNELKGDMGFDDLFRADYWYKNDGTGEEWQNSFFQHTKAMYLTDEIKVSKEQVKELQNLLKENVWYQYFSDHVREVKTWIDFETKIEDALKLVCIGVYKIEEEYSKSGQFDLNIYTTAYKNSRGYQFSELQIDLLALLKLFVKNQKFNVHVNNSYGRDIRAGSVSVDFFKVKEHPKYGFDSYKYLMFLQMQLENFIKIFNIYLEVIVSQLTRSHLLFINGENWVAPDMIYSFNYTNTYQRIYNAVEVEYLHGSHGEQQNIVLGISDLKDDFLKQIKAYGFTKYHQKLLKNTDYMFLKYNEKITKNCLQWNKWDINKFDAEKLKFNQFRTNIYIWGHSLDVSDEVYINEIFTLNTNNEDKNVRVTVYYFNQQANFDLLANLIHILGKEKVEIWMKNKWLQFKENPKILTEDVITLKDLPKM